jgi:hypothetical protein
MTGQYFGERFNTSDNVENTDKDMNSPVVNSDAFADKVPVDPALIHETPMGGTLAAVGPMNGPVADEIPMYQTPIQEIPMGGTIAAARPMDETIVPQVPIDETTTYKASVGVVTAAEEAWVTKPVPYQVPVTEMVSHETPVVTTGGLPVALLDHQESEPFRTRWNEIQGMFVDDPRTAVQQADGLVSEVVEQITKMFTSEHSSLEAQWKQGNNVSTEDLRKALQHYRSFFNRLVV